MTQDKEFEKLIEKITNLNIEQVQKEIALGFQKMYNLAIKAERQRLKEEIIKLSYWAKEWGTPLIKKRIYKVISRDEVLALLEEKK